MQLIETGFMLAAVVLLAVLGWALFVYFKPDRECRWCRLFARVHLRCWRCKGTRRTWRLGARHAHKVKLSLRQAWQERGES